MRAPSPEAMAAEIWQAAPGVYPTCADGIRAERKRVLVALVEVAKLDFPTGGGVEHVVCLVLAAAMKRIGDP